MSNVVAVGVFTAGSTLLAAGIGAITTYMVSARNAKAAVDTAESQNEVELARIAAENSRLREQYEEEERRNRQGTYHRTLTALQRIYGLDHDDEDWDQVTAEWRYCRAGIHIFGSKEAIDAVDRVQEVVLKLPGPDEEREAWGDELKGAMDQFVTAVRADIGVEAVAED